MLSNQDLRRMFNELDRMTGQNTKSIPVGFNGRLKKALGRYRFFNVSFTPYGFEFNSTLKHMSYDEVKQIVIHEYAHYLRNSVYAKGQFNHDKEFKRIVRSLGGSETEPTVSSGIMSSVKESDKIEKPHAVYCEKCGKVLRQYKTKCASISNYTSGGYTCHCGGKLSYKNLND